jgi:hypothetical protein
MHRIPLHRFAASAICLFGVLAAALPAQACLRFTNRTAYTLDVEASWIGVGSPRQYTGIAPHTRADEFHDGACHDLWNVKTRYVVTALLPGGQRTVVYDTAQHHPAGTSYSAGGNRHVTIFTAPDNKGEEAWFLEDRLF